MRLTSRMSVHPRRRGEHNSRASGAWPANGSSPQARGTPAISSESLLSYRFIPAGAGNTQLRGSVSAGVAVHPRRRGEHAAGGCGVQLGAGSSPQARGTPTRFPAHCLHCRFIPAGAGNTNMVAPQVVDGAVHPRRRGEHMLLPNPGGQSYGSSPQARGTLSDPLDHVPRHRFIPAGAGNTTEMNSSDLHVTVHPRRRGEHSVTYTDRVPACRFIPAGAGNTRHRAPPRGQIPVHPRRRGEHRGWTRGVTSYAGSSPQARGTQRGPHADATARRFIPAGAGNTVRERPADIIFPVHPRRRGEHSSGGSSSSSSSGSSPQARGTPVLIGRSLHYTRFIPAGAGNTHRDMGPE